MIFTVQHAIDAVRKYVDGGTCDSTRCISRINEAQEALIFRAAWPMTRRMLRFRVTNGHIALPRFVARIEQATLDQRPSRVWSEHYRFLEGGPGRIDCSAEFVHHHLADLGDGHPTFSDPPLDEDAYLLAMCENVKDVSAQIRIQGMSEKMVPVILSTPGEIITPNQWASGTEGALTGIASLKRSESIFRTVDAVQKPVTKGYVNLYAVAPATGKFWYLAKYAPDETNPGYRRYKLVGSDSTTDVCVVALCKIRYAPAAYATDQLLIQNLGAIKYMCIALEKYESSKVAEGQFFETRAIALLSAQHLDDQPNEGELQYQCDEYGAAGVRTVV